MGSNKNVIGCDWRTHNTASCSIEKKYGRFMEIILTDPLLLLLLFARVFSKWCDFFLPKDQMFAEKHVIRCINRKREWSVITVSECCQWLQDHQVWPIKLRQVYIFEEFHLVELFKLHLMTCFLCQAFSVSLVLFADDFVYIRSLITQEATSATNFFPYRKSGFVNYMMLYKMQTRLIFFLARIFWILVSLIGL